MLPSSIFLKISFFVIILSDMINLRSIKVGIKSIDRRTKGNSISKDDVYTISNKYNKI